MINAIRELGFDISSDSTGLESKIKPINFGKKKEPVFCIINFDSKYKKISMEMHSLNSNISKNVAKKYLWVGNLKGASPQWRSTSDTFMNILFSLPILYKRVKDEIFKNKIEKIISIYYPDEKIIDLNNCEIDIMSQHYTTNSDQFKMDLKEKIKGKKLFIDKIVKFTNNLNKYNKDIALFTISLDNELIICNSDYKNILQSSIGLDEVMNDNPNKGYCSICNKFTDVTDDTKKFEFKYYNRDKISFASNLRKFQSNFNICESCYEYILSGENFIFENLKTYLGNNVLIIPEKIIKIENIDEKLKIEKIFKITNSIINDNMNSIREIENVSKEEYIINLMFYEKINNSFKIYDIITGIPESRILLIAKKLTKTYNDFSLIYDETNIDQKTINLKSFIGILKNGMDSANTSKIFLIIKKIFMLQHIEFKEVIAMFLGGIRRDYFKNNRVYPNNILNMNSYLKFLANLEVIEHFNEKHDIKGDINMENNSLFDEMGYSKEEAGLFSIGYVLRKIEKIQYVYNITGHPLLEKLNFNGMNFKSLERFMLHLDEKIRQYNINSSDILNELYNSHSILSKYSSRKEDWPIDDITNVFIIMTGYSSVKPTGNKNEVRIEDEEED